MMEMRKIFSFIIFFIFLSFGLIFCKGGFFKRDISVNADVNYFSKYVFRGTVIDNKKVLQKSFGLSFSSFSANIWSNQPIEDDSNRNFSNEVDYSLEYYFNLDKLGFTIGYIKYTYPNSSANTDEIYTTISYDFFINPVILFANDNTNGGRYFEFDLN